mmetsp:Transcript_58736/g.65748  ORF Transcript_58736/g.65748 Transcript_58736/m.65748 type:complete len:218 (-) Transcript_58736:1144-1797(-)
MEKIPPHKMVMRLLWVLTLINHRNGIQVEPIRSVRTVVMQATLVIHKHFQVVGEILLVPEPIRYLAQQIQALRSVQVTQVVEELAATLVKQIPVNLVKRIIAETTNSVQQSTVAVNSVQPNIPAVTSVQPNTVSLVRPIITVHNSHFLHNQSYRILPVWKKKSQKEQQNEDHCREKLVPLLLWHQLVRTNLTMMTVRKVVVCGRQHSCRLIVARTDH